VLGNAPPCPEEGLTDCEKQTTAKIKTKSPSRCDSLIMYSRKTWS
jgi:hypothetical protein